MTSTRSHRIALRLGAISLAGAWMLASAGCFVPYGFPHHAGRYERHDRRDRDHGRWEHGDPHGRGGHHDGGHRRKRHRHDD